MARHRFYENELTLHESALRKDRGSDWSRHSVDMGDFCVPHFGIHLTMEDNMVVSKSVEANNSFQPLSNTTTTEFLAANSVAA